MIHQNDRKSMLFLTAWVAFWSQWILICKQKVHKRSCRCWCLFNSQNLVLLLLWLLFLGSSSLPDALALINNEKPAAIANVKSLHGCNYLLPIEWVSVECCQRVNVRGGLRSSTTNISRFFQLLKFHKSWVKEELVGHRPILHLTHVAKILHLS